MFLPAQVLPRTLRRPLALPPDWALAIQRDYAV